MTAFVLPDPLSSSGYEEEKENYTNALSHKRPLRRDFSGSSHSSSNFASLCESIADQDSTFLIHPSARRASSTAGLSEYSSLSSEYSIVRPDSNIKHDVSMLSSPNGSRASTTNQSQLAGPEITDSEVVRGLQEDLTKSQQAFQRWQDHIGKSDRMQVSFALTTVTVA